MQPVAIAEAHPKTERRIVVVGADDFANDLRTLLDRHAIDIEQVDRLDAVDSVASVDAALFGMLEDIDAVVNASQRLRQANPQCLRVFIHPDDTVVCARVFDYVHQVMPESRARTALIPTLQRCFRLREVLLRANSEMALSGLESLPSLPHVYHEFVRASQCESVEFAELADIVEHDIALSARILGLANSAHFGLNSTVTSIQHAISVLGLEMLSALVTATSLFGALTDGRSARRLETLWMHASNVSQLAIAIASCERSISRADRAEVAQAGLLHDIGQLAILTRIPDAHRIIDKASVHDGIEVCELERRELGATHSEIGACLLAYWGVSERTVEATALHHNIAAASRHEDPVVSAVFAANALLAQEDGGTASYSLNRTPDDDELDSYFGQQRVGKWRFELARYRGD
ncbi:MAG: HDOD domain-containing protein [Pseudomonadota bacterium]